MVEPIEQDLYVMQNEFGLIKIGRSLDAERRRISLQTSERCKIKIVEVFSGCGDMEEGLHLDMDEYRLAGEWFDGSDSAKAAIYDALGTDPLSWDWPYPLDASAAGEWLDHLHVVRDAAAISREIYRAIKILRDANDASWTYDTLVFSAKHRAKTGDQPFLDITKRKGKTVVIWHDYDAKTETIVPEYTHDIEAALSAWPVELRPATWEGSAIECCIAALTAIRQSLPKIPRKST